MISNLNENDNQIAATYTGRINIQMKWPSSIDIPFRIMHELRIDIFNYSNRRGSHLIVTLNNGRSTR